MDSIVSFEEKNLNLAKDPFLETTAFKNYQKFRIEDHKINLYLKNKTKIPFDFIENYKSLNPDYWVVYYKAGLYFYQQKYFELAKENFEKALTKEITTVPDKEAIEKYLKKLKRKLQ